MNRTPVENAVASALRALDAPPAAPDLFASIQKGVRRRSRGRLAAAAGALAVSGVVVGSVASDAGRGAGPERAIAADPVQVLRADSSTGSSSGPFWSTLRGVLPNVRYTYDSAGRPMQEQATDSVVVGRVVRSEPGYGMLGQPLVEGEDVRTRQIAFDDPRAAWRILSVTVQVSETLAGAPAEELILDWTILGPSQRGQDARTVGQALEDLGTIVVLSKASPSRPEFVPGRSALGSGYGIARVAAEGRLDFPLIVPNEGPTAAAFQDGIDTLSELRAEAQKPTRTEPAVPAGQ